MMQFVSFQTLLHWYNQHAIVIVAILVGGLLASLLLRQVLNRFHSFLKRSSEGSAKERAARAKTLSTVIFTGASVIIWTIVVLLILDNLGINIGPFLASAGIVGLAVSFGSQELVKDVISGFFFLLENQLNTGDLVEIQGKQGRVREVSLRSVTLFDDESGNMYMVRNSQVGTITRLPEPEVTPGQTGRSNHA